MCAVRNAEWEWGGGGARQTQGNHSENLAKPERNQSEQHAAYTRPAGGRCRGWRGLRAPLMGWSTAGRRERTQECRPERIIRTPHSIPGSNFSGDPVFAWFVARIYWCGAVSLPRRTQPEMPKTGGFGRPRAARWGQARSATRVEMRRGVAAGSGSGCQALIIPIFTPAESNAINWPN